MKMNERGGDKNSTEMKSWNKCEEEGGYRAGLRATPVCGIYLRDITSFMNATNVRFAEREGWGHGGIDGDRPLSQMSDLLSANGEAQRSP